MFKIIRKADIVLLIILLVLGLLLTAASIHGRTTGEQVLVTVNGKEYARYDLSVDREVEITLDGHTNKFSISKGKVQMSYSTCKNQLCVNTGSISETNQNIVCLPNRVSISIVGRDGDTDAVAK